MTGPKIVPDRALPSEVTLTGLHKSTGDILNRALRAPVTVTKYGRPHITFVDARYFERLDEIAAMITSQIPREKGARWD